jgi:hypothetical protein
LRAGRERGLAATYAGVRRCRRGEYADTYTTLVPVRGYPSRRVTIEIDRRAPEHARVFADGSTISPHRHAGRGGTELCIWHPNDPEDRRWTPEEGLAVLFGMAAVHLFKEAWWRDTREWLGDEAPHAPSEPAPDLRPALRESA